MIGAYAIVALALFLMGVLGGFIAVISVASHRDRDFTTGAPGRIARGARTANGVHTRFYEPVYYRHDLPLPADREW